MDMVLKKYVGLYVRVSIDIQVDGYSIDEQLDRLRKYCEAHGWIIVKEYVDPGYSGASIDRPAMLSLLKDVREKKLDTVLVYKLDRLSRSQKDTLYLIEEEFLPNGVDFISMSENFDTSTPFGKAMIGILSVFAQLEREQIKERLAMGHVGRAKAGYWRGGSNPPIGYDFKDGKLVVNEYEALQVRKIFKLFLDGESIHSISKYMNENYTNKYSSYKDSGQVGVILRNSLYIGKIKYKGQEYDGVHEPIIDEETFNRVQTRYKEISSKWDTHYRSPYKGKHLLTGLLFCGNCGARYFACSCKAKKGVKYSYYKCYSRDGNTNMKKIDGCKNPTYTIDKLDSVIMDEIKKLKTDTKYLDNIIKYNQKEPEDDSAIRILEKKLKDVETKVNKLMDLYTIGSIHIEDISNRVKPLYEEKEKLERQIAEIKEDTKAPEILSVKETRDILDKYDIDKADHDTKRQLVQALIKRIEVGTEEDSLKIYWKFI